MSKGSPRATPAAVFGLAAALALAPEARGEFGDPVRGQSLFVEKGCVQCHAVRGTGGRIGPDLGRTAVKGSFFELAAGIWNHAVVMGNKMQEARITRPSFRNAELGDLIAFLYFLNYFDEPGDPKVGKVLFVQKHCIQCHRIGQEGGTAGPPLDRLPSGTAPLRIAQGLWNHGPVMVPAIRRMGMEVPKFEGSEIVDLFAYLRSRGQRQAVREFRSAGDPERGKKVFADKGCASCHAIFGRGSAIGPDLGKVELRGSVTQLAGRMWNHWPAMTEAMGALGMASPTFHGDEMADLFAFLFLSRYEGRPGDIALGKALFELKGCSACHGQRGEGNIGPALGPFVAGQKKEQIAQLMWNHASAMSTSMRTYGVPWPRFEADEMSNLIAFLAGGLPNSPPAGSESRSPAKSEPAVKK